MRRKAQAIVSLPAQSGMDAEQLIADFLQALPQAASAMPAQPHLPIELEPSAGKEPYAEMAQVVEHEATAGDPREAAAFDKLSCGLKCLEEGLEIFKQYEEMEEEEVEVEGEKKEQAALKKINKLIEDMKKVYKELVEAEVQEHEEKAEIDSEAAKNEETEVEEKKEASVKAFTRTASKKEGFVPTDLGW